VLLLLYNISIKKLLLELHYRQYFQLICQQRTVVVFLELFTFLMNWVTKMIQYLTHKDK